MPYLTGDTPEPNKWYCRVTRIPHSLGFLQAVGGALAELTHPWNWEKFGTMTPDESAEAATNLYLEWANSDVCMIGTITAYVTITPPGNCLPCNGSTYLRTDYPVLYERLAAAYIVDADHFRTPDLRDKFVIGASVDHPLASTGGALEHTLTEAQMPAHTHTSPPHAHSEVAAVPTIINGGIEAPASAATPTGATTGLTSVTIDSTGGGEPFPIVPPYEALLYCIVAR